MNAEGTSNLGASDRQWGNLPVPGRPQPKGMPAPRVNRKFDGSAAEQDAAAVQYAKAEEYLKERTKEIRKRSIEKNKPLPEPRPLPEPPPQQVVTGQQPPPRRPNVLGKTPSASTPPANTPAAGPEREGRRVGVKELRKQLEERNVLLGAQPPQGARLAPEGQPASGKPHPDLPAPRQKPRPAEETSPVAKAKPLVASPKTTPPPLLRSKEKVSLSSQPPSVEGAKTQPQRPVVGPLLPRQKIAKLEKEANKLRRKEGQWDSSDIHDNEKIQGELKGLYGGLLGQAGQMTSKEIQESIKILESERDELMKKHPTGYQQKVHLAIIPQLEQLQTILKKLDGSEITEIRRRIEALGIEAFKIKEDAGKKDRFQEIFKEISTLQSEINELEQFKE